MAGEDTVLSKEGGGEKLSGGRNFANRLDVAGLLKAGNRIPPSGATVGEFRGPLEDICNARRVRIWWSEGVEGTMLGLSWVGSVAVIVVGASGVVIVSPKLLGFFLGALGGTINAGVGGAENAWDALEVFEKANFGREGPCRFDADVFTDRFFMLRNFLLGDSARSTPGRVGNELEN